MLDSIIVTVVLFVGGFLFLACIAEIVEIINDLKCNEKNMRHRRGDKKSKK